MDTHGGSLRGMAGLAGGPHHADGSVVALIELEEKSGLDRAETFSGFAARIDALGDGLKKLTREIKAKGKSIGFPMDLQWITNVSGP